MGVTVRVRSRPDATIVHLAGPADPELLVRVGDALARMPGGDTTTLVVDVSDLTLIHPRAVTALVDSLLVASGEPPRLVCRRHTGRRIVRRSSARALVFGSISGALAHSVMPVAATSRQARLLETVADVVSDAVADTLPAPIGH